MRLNEFPRATTMATEAITARATVFINLAIERDHIFYVTPIVQFLHYKVGIIRLGVSA